MPAYVLAHSCGRPGDVAKRLTTVWNAGPHGIWINRYGYLGDQKMKIVTGVCKQ